MPAYATTAQLANRLRGQAIPVAQATQALEEASAVVDTFIGWPLGTAAYSWTVEPLRAGPVLYVPHRITAVASVTVDGVAWDAAAYVFDAARHTLKTTAAAPLASWPRGAAIVVGGTSGYTDAALPAVVRSVVLSVAVRTLTNPGGGVRSESLSDHAITYAGDDPTCGAYLTETEEALLDSTGLRDWAFG